MLVGLLVAVTAMALRTRLSRAGCYWAGIIVTHPLGAAMGDFMTKEDGLHLGNALSTLLLAIALLRPLADWARRCARQLPTFASS